VVSLSTASHTASQAVWRWWRQKVLFSASVAARLRQRDCAQAGLPLILEVAHVVPVLPRCVNHPPPSSARLPARCRARCASSASIDSLLLVCVTCLCGVADRARDLMSHRRLHHRVRWLQARVHHAAAKSNPHTRCIPRSSPRLPSCVLLFVAVSANLPCVAGCTRAFADAALGTHLVLSCELEPFTWLVYGMAAADAACGTQLLCRVLASCTRRWPVHRASAVLQCRVGWLSCAPRAKLGLQPRQRLQASALTTRTTSSSPLPSAGQQLGFLQVLQQVWHLLRHIE